ncbi:ABC transporter permease [Ectobacillus ponti]|uniref:ABC transporter permease n=1 Tax=Ectobacillus ponti TaxID=2961894 RepID=A0AA41X8Q7_9BACI|nr:ABC transporter permease [Ectobacillus ponti]MCP8968945.1 ABC transporter permease [Ectobacillus ponti]
MDKRLFSKRLLSEWKQKMTSLRTVADWTVALYCIIPALVFAGLYYRSLWLDPPPWSRALPGTAWLFGMYLVTYGRQARSFLEEADSLFLLQQPHLLRGIRWRGTAYTGMRVACSSILAAALFWPLLQLGAGELLRVVLCFIFIRWAGVLLNRLVALRFGGKWKRGLLQIPFFLGGWYALWGSVYAARLPISAWICVPIVLAGLVALLVKKRLADQGGFLREAVLERAEAMRWTSILVLGSGQVQKPVHDKKPALFPKSKRIWPGNRPDARFLDSFLKDYFRTSPSRSFYWQLTAYSLVPSYIAPWWLSLLVAAFALLGLYQSSGSHWREFASKPLLQLYGQNGRVLLLGQQARMYTLLPALAVYLVRLAACWSIWVGLSGLVLLAAVLLHLAFAPAGKRPA